MVSLRSRFSLVTCAALLAASAAHAGAPPQHGRYRGKGVVESRVDGKLTARQKFEIVGVFLQDGTLQAFLPDVPPLPFWETRHPQGAPGLAKAFFSPPPLRPATA